MSDIDNMTVDELIAGMIDIDELHLIELYKTTKSNDAVALMRSALKRHRHDKGTCEFMEDLERVVHHISGIQCKTADDMFGLALADAMLYAIGVGIGEADYELGDLQEKIKQLFDWYSISKHG